MSFFDIFYGERKSYDSFYNHNESLKFHEDDYDEYDESDSVDEEE